MQQQQKLHLLPLTDTQAVAVLGKNIWGRGPSSFGRQQRLSEITIEPIKNLGGLGKIWGPVPSWPQHRTATALKNLASKDTEQSRKKG